MPYELEVVYLDSSNNPVSKKSVRYPDHAAASQVYRATIETLTARGGAHLVILRALDAAGAPTMILNERVGWNVSEIKKAPKGAKK